MDTNKDKKGVTHLDGETLPEPAGEGSENNKTSRMAAGPALHSVALAAEDYIEDAPKAQVRSKIHLQKGVKEEEIHELPWS